MGAAMRLKPLFKRAYLRAQPVSIFDNNSEWAAEQPRWRCQMYHSRLNAPAAAVSLVTIGFILMVIALTSDRWGSHEINIPGRDDM